MSFLQHSKPANHPPAHTDLSVGSPGAGRNGRVGIKAGRRRLSSTQREIVQVCEAAAQQFGFSRSVGKIFGVLYVSSKPLAFADVAASVELSSGSVSQGLRFLRELGVIKVVSVQGDRRDLFATETELRRFLVEALRARLREPLMSGSARLKALKKRLSGSVEPDREFIAERLGRLQAWHHKALLILPLVQRSLGSDRG